MKKLVERYLTLTEIFWAAKQAGLDVVCIPEGVIVSRGVYEFVADKQNATTTEGDGVTITCMELKEVWHGDWVRFSKPTTVKWASSSGESGKTWFPGISSDQGRELGGGGTIAHLILSQLGIVPIEESDVGNS